MIGPCSGSSVRPGRTGHLQCALAGRTARTKKKHCTTSFFGWPERTGRLTKNHAHPGRAHPGRAPGPCVRAWSPGLKQMRELHVFHAYSVTIEFNLKYSYSFQGNSIYIQGHAFWDHRKAVEGYTV